MKNPLLILLAALILACSTTKKEAPLMELLSPEQTGIDFTNKLVDDEDVNIITFEYFYNGAGVGISDINNDGLQDIFFAANMSENKLYLNAGQLHFKDITQQAGFKSSGKWATGVSMIDINQDSLMDIYVCYAGPSTDPAKRANELYINNGNNTFTERAGEYGLADTGHSVQAAFFDYDKDGDLDVYILTNITDQTGPNIIRPKRLKGEMVNTDRLYRNNGNNTFTNVSHDAGITIEGYGLGVSICDINNDGWQDVYVSNDYLSNDLLYINNRDGTFTDRMTEYFKHTSYSAMGNDVSDFNNDGLVDIVAVDMLPPDNKRQKMMFGSTNYDRYRSEIKYGYAPQFMRNTLQLNVGTTSQPLFSEIGQLSGIDATDWSWSPLFADIDNDGWRDLLVTNGYARDITNRDFVNYKMHEFMNYGYDKSVKKKLLEAINSIEGAHIPIFAFRNNGDLTFTDHSSAWGFTQPAYSTGAAYADLDNDGDLDYVTNNINGPAFVFENHSDKKNQNHFLNIRLEGPAGNIQAHGTKTWLYCGDSTVQYQEHTPYRGYQSSVEQSLHFGMGQTKIIDSIRIQWPDGKQQLLRKVESNQTLKLKYEAAPDQVNVKRGPDDITQPLFFTDKTRNISFVHHETEYADFKIQPLLPHKYSEGGPGIAVGDVDDDGLEDFFVGGAFRQSGQFFLQNKNGTFKTRALTDQPKFEEDMGMLLFDADGDNDNDLYIVSGGNEFAHGSTYYQDRLYYNDGKGNFAYNKGALPSSTASGSCVIAADYDKDGDLDLFTGGRLSPHHYPQAGESAILNNENGRFKDVTEQVAPGLRNIGMVTSALWSDVDNDDQPDLVIVGEWMPVTIFKNTKGKFERTEIPNSTGWWNSIHAGDFDEDGDTDYVMGNLGLNSKYKTSPEQPVSVCVGDFNQDGAQDAILAHYIQGVNRPAHPRDDIFLQIVQFKKKYQTYKAYSEATMETMIAGTNTTPTILKTQTFQSSYLENKGSSGWKLSPLPMQAQFAPVFGIAANDYDDDGHLDIVLSGNSYASDVLTGRYDAFKGLILKGDGLGKFYPIPTRQSGMLIDGNAKALAQLVDARGQLLLLATQNNDSLKIFEGRSESIRFIDIRPNDIYALVTHSNGKRSRHEFYYGSGYLSQSSRKAIVPANAINITIHGSDGLQRSESFTNGN